MKNKRLIILLIALIITSCGSVRKIGVVDYGSPNIKQELLNDITFKIELYSQDDTYGYTERNPIMVGGGNDGPKNERRFLNALSGPNGEQIEYYRIGSCCSFKTNNGVFGDTGLLDIYNITYDGLDKSLKLYLNMYDSDTLKTPVGLEIKK